MKGVNMVTNENLIHDAAKEIHVEPHVLRYWEEELNLNIPRNERGHRIYRKEDMEKISYIKYLKEQGLRLKAIKQWMEEEENSTVEMNNNVIPIHFGYIDKRKESQMIEIKEKKMTAEEQQKFEIKMKENKNEQEIIDEKVYKMQAIIQKMFSNILIANNNSLIDELTENIKCEINNALEKQLKEMEEEQKKSETQRREFETNLVQATLKQQEEHYAKIDQLLREKNMKKDHPKKIQKVARIF